MAQMLNKSIEINSDISLYSIPKHIAIIMDGNRRYARKNNISIEKGHIAGAENLLKITEEAVNLGVEVLTVYAFSTENWLRSDPEIQSLFHTFEIYLKRMKVTLLKNKIKLSTIGDLDPFPHTLKKTLYDVKHVTSEGSQLELVLAINYGGRDDVTRAIRNIVKDVTKGNISEEDISEEIVGRYLYTSKWPDPDLLIRTSGEQRVSNFLLWQISYTELYLEKKFWPEFSVKNFREAIIEYSNRVKRLGV